MKNAQLIFIGIIIWKIISIPLYVYFHTSAWYELLIAFAIVGAKIYLLDRKYIGALVDNLSQYKLALLLLIVGDINFIMVIPALIDMLQDVFVSHLVTPKGSTHSYGTYAIISSYSIGKFNALVIIIYVLEIQIYNYLSAHRKNL